MDLIRFNPISVLRKSITAVPAVKWSLGVAGIAVASALVRQSVIGATGGSGGLADIAMTLGLMFFFMALLVIFARLARTAPSFLVGPAIVLAWFSLFLFMASSLLSAISIFFGWPRSFSDLTSQIRTKANASSIETGSRKKAPGDELVMRYMDEILILRGDFESIDKNPGAPEQVKRDGKRLAELIGNVEDDSLNPPRKIIKYEYQGWALSMVARTYAGSDAEQKRERIYYATKAIEAFGKALARMEEVKRKSREGDKYAVLDYEWITSTESDDFNRTLYLKAVAVAVVARAGGSYTKNEVRAELSKISDDFIKQYPIEKIPELNWAKN